MLELLIRGATVVDGTGAPARQADVGVRNGKIAALGRVREGAARTVEAGGLCLMPGIVDVHTHYDAQITWDATLSPSVSLGVTTAILGNCGFGIAPCPAPLRETLVKNLSVVEGMDLNALLQGTRWEFETFAEYLDALERARPYANVGVLAGHSTIRTAVMGEEASLRAAPTGGELSEMRRLVREALQAGAAGFASSFSPNHSGWGGKPMPSTIAGDEELKALAAELKTAGRGIFVMATGPRATPEYMEQIAADTGRPAFMVTVLTMYNRAQPERALQYYERCAAALRRGREVYIHTSCQPLSFDFTLREPYLFYSHDAFERVKAAAPQERAAIYREPAFRKHFRDNLRNPKSGILFHGDWSQVELDGVPVTRLASDPLELVFDLPLDTQLVAKLFLRCRLRPAFSRALGARHRHLHAGGGRAPPDQRPGAQVPDPGARRDRAGELGRSLAVRARQGGDFAAHPAKRSSGGRNAHDARAARRARRVGKRTRGLRRGEIFAAARRRRPCP
jgi:N-acyl-D-amino-acid deacylase